MLEAMFVGCPIVTTDLPLLRELIGTPLRATVCPPEQPIALAERLSELLRSDELRRYTFETERAIASSLLSPDGLAARYEGLYTSVQARDGVRRSAQLAA